MATDNNNAESEIAHNDMVGHYLNNTSEDLSEPSASRRHLESEAHPMAIRHLHDHHDHHEHHDHHDHAIMPELESIPDINQYQHRKTLAKGMMDLALFSANANQLRYVMESFDMHPYYWPNLILISFSILLQVAIGLGLILNMRYNINNEDEIHTANKINNFTVIGIFLVTAVNIFISAFGVAVQPLR